VTGAPDPEAISDAREAGLRYVSDQSPGIRRTKAAGSFLYLDAQGDQVRDRETLKRIEALVIPPAWTDVWISPIANGHIQATGRDARGRKQYRYHERWRAVRDANKYGRLIEFARVLPRIRRRVRRDLARPDLSRERVLATVVQLLESTMIRVGNEEYAKENESFGLTTLRSRHVKVRGSQVQFVDEEGQLRSVDSSDVNDYIRDASGSDFTAKDFRTWAGTVLAARALQEMEKVDSETQAKKNVVAAIESVARRLGNTRSVCRKCYVHPAVVDSYLDGSMLDVLQARAQEEMRSSLHRLRPEEAAVLALLQQRLKAEARGRRRAA
jgi:DNA topoisomerase-1